MANILLIFISLILGALLKRSIKLPDQSHVTLNQYVIWIAIPSLALHYIPIKLFLAPILFIWILYRFCFGQNGQEMKVCVLEAAMAPW